MAYQGKKKPNGNLAMITLIGTLASDIEFSYAGEKGTPMAKTKMAVDVGWGDRMETVWYNITSFRRAEWMAQNLKKGSLVVITGTSVCKGWKSKDGANMASEDFTVDTITFGPRSYVNNSDDEGTGEPEQDGPEGKPNDEPPAQQGKPEQKHTSDPLGDGIPF